MSQAAKTDGAGGASAAVTTSSAVTEGADTGAYGKTTTSLRQPRPQKADIHYAVARMTHLTISTEELATLGFSSGIGSLALSGTIFFANEAVSSGIPLAIDGVAFFAAITIASYVFFGGLVRRIRMRSKLSGWRIFSD